MAIYFIQAGTNGPIKIGYTDNDIQNRIAQLQTGCPYELKLIWLYTGGDYSESEIHAMFDHERVRGEWFHPSEEIINFIINELTNDFNIESKNGTGINIIEDLNGETIYTKTCSIFVNYKENSIALYSSKKPNIEIAGGFGRVYLPSNYNPVIRDE